MSKKRSHLVLTFIKLLVAAGVIVWLFRKVDPQRVLTTMREAHRGPILLGLLLCWTTIVFAAWRWQRLLRVFDIAISFRSLLCIAQIGPFFALFLPGPTGDDLTRMLYIARLAPGRVAESCSTVLLDRCIGLTGLFLLGLSCLPWQWHLLTASHQTYWLAVTILAGGSAVAIGGAVFFLAGHPTHRWFERRLRSRPAHSLRDEAARIWGLFCDNKSVIAQVILVAVVTQLVNCVLFYLAGSAVGIQLPLGSWLSFVPIVLAASALPISIAGLGVREYLLVLFLGAIGSVGNESALAASFVAFSIILTVCLVGGLLYVFYKPKGEAPAPAT
jgi:hypothetical protein